MADTPFLRTEQSYTLNDKPVLIVDKTGSLGNELARETKDSFITILVSPKDELEFDNIVNIPFRRKLPKIPDNIFSHIFVHYTGEKELESCMPLFLKKARESRAPLILIVNIYNQKTKFIRKWQQEYEGVTTIYIGDVFGRAWILPSVVNDLLHQANTTGSMTLLNDGLAEIYPVHIEDVVAGIIEAVFTHRSEKTFFLFPQTAYTQLTLARIYQRSHPSLRFSFLQKKQQKRQQLTIPNGGVYLLGSSYTLDSKVSDAPDALEPKQQQAEQKSQVEDSRGLSLKSLAPFLFFFLFLLLLPLITTVGFSLFGIGMLNASQDAMKEGNFSSAKQLATLGRNAFSASEQTSGTVSWAAKQLNLKKHSDAFLDMVELGQETSVAFIDIADAVDALQRIFHKQSRSPEQEFLQATNSLKRTLIFLQKAGTEKRLQPHLKQLSKYEKEMQFLVNTLDVLPTIAGFDGKKTYLILFQNNMELRPGGGFIGSYGLLTAENGVVEEFTIHDVYDADGKLQRHVDPPYALRRFMGVKHWYLRDSNFDIDFLKNSANAAYFLKHETGVQADAVIAIDVSFLKRLLKIVGPVDVPDYKVTINEDNFYLLTQENAQSDFFPGSTQKKDFLRSAFSALQLALQKKKDTIYVDFLKELTQSIEDKHFLIAFADQSVQNVFTVNNFSSTLWDARETIPTTLNDTFGISEANVGENKANYYIVRSVDYRLELRRDGKSKAKARIAYENRSDDKKEFGGDYKNYLRLVLPLSATLDEVLINGVKQKIVAAVTDPNKYEQSRFIPPQGLEVEEQQESGKKVIGLYVTVPKASQKTLEILYALNHSPSSQIETFTYDGWIIKQPGTDDYPVTFKITLPESSRFVEASSGFTKSGNSLQYSGQQTKDIHIKTIFVGE